MHGADDDAVLIHGWLLVRSTRVSAHQRRIPNGAPSAPPSSARRRAAASRVADGDDDALSSAAGLLVGESASLDEPLEGDSDDDAPAPAPGGGAAEDAVVVDSHLAASAAENFSRLATPPRRSAVGAPSAAAPPDEPPCSAVTWSRHAPRRLTRYVDALSRMRLVLQHGARVEGCTRRGGSSGGVAASSSDECRDSAVRGVATGALPLSSQASSPVPPHALGTVRLLALEAGLVASRRGLAAFATNEGVRGRLVRLLVALLPARVSEWLSIVGAYAASPSVRPLLAPKQQRALEALGRAAPWQRRVLGAALLHELELAQASPLSRTAAVAVSAVECDAGAGSGGGVAARVEAGLEELQRAGLLLECLSRAVVALDNDATVALVSVARVRRALPRALVDCARDALVLTLAPLPGQFALSRAVTHMLLGLGGCAAFARPDAPARGPFALFAHPRVWVAYKAAGVWLAELQALTDALPVLAHAAAPVERTGAKRQRQREGSDGDDNEVRVTDDTRARARVGDAVRQLNALVSRVVVFLPLPSGAGGAGISSTSVAGGSTSNAVAHNAIEAAATATAAAAAEPDSNAVHNLKRSVYLWRNSTVPAPNWPALSGCSDAVVQAAFDAEAAHFTAAPATQVLAVTPMACHALPPTVQVQEWVGARSAPASALCSGLFKAACAYEHMALWLCSTRGVRKGAPVPGCSAWVLSALQAGGATYDSTLRAAAGGVLPPFAQRAPQLLLAALQLLYFIVQLPPRDAGGTLRLRLWSWHLLLRLASDAAGAETLHAALVRQATCDPFLRSARSECLPDAVSSALARAVVRAPLKLDRGGVQTALPYPPPEVDSEDTADEDDESMATPVPVVFLAGMRWPGRVLTVKLSNVRHATGPPPSVAGEPLPVRVAPAPPPPSAAASQQSKRGACGGAGNAAVEGVGSHRAFHVCGDGMPGTVERLACEALVQCEPLRTAVLAAAKAPPAVGSVAVGSIAVGSVADGRAPSPIASGAVAADASLAASSLRPATVVFGFNALRGTVTPALAGVKVLPGSALPPEWPPGLLRGAAGRAAAAANALAAGGGAAHMGCPWALRDAFPALADVPSCAAPPGRLAPGELRVRDAGLGYVADAPAAPEIAGGALSRWRACFTENAAWPLLFSALLHEEIVGSLSLDTVLEWTWKHPWQDAPLDMGSMTGGFLTLQRRDAIEARIAAIASAPCCEVAAQARKGLTAQHGLTLLRNRYDAFAGGHLADLAHAAGGPLLARILWRLAADVASLCVGFPDVALWRTPACCGEGALAQGAAAADCPSSHDDACFALIEVKSQTDTLRPSQLRVLHHMDKHRKPREGLGCCILAVKSVVTALPNLN